MPELPDVTVYLERLEPRVVGRPIEELRIRSAFLVRTFDPPVSEARGKTVRKRCRFGKRIVFGLDDDLFLVFHLMIAGRFRWRERGAKIHAPDRSFKAPPGRPRPVRGGLIGV